MMLPIEKARLADTIYQRLLDEMLAGRFELGGRLPPEVELARGLGVSRPVLREALRRLRHDGIIVSRQGAGTYLQRLPSSRLGEHLDTARLSLVLEGFELRMALEPLAARLAARHRSEAQLAGLERLAGELRAAFEARRLPVEEDHAFHRAIAVASGNGLLVGALDQLAEPVKRGLGVTLSLTRVGSSGRRARVLDEHERVLRAIRLSDAEGAALAMAYHLDQARNRLLDRNLDA